VLVGRLLEVAQGLGATEATGTSGPPG
jgi:hypothetical protein